MIFSTLYGSNCSCLRNSVCRGNEKDKGNSWRKNYNEGDSARAVYIGASEMKAAQEAIDNPVTFAQN